MWLMSLIPDDSATPSPRRKVNFLWLGGLTAIGLATAIWGLGNVLMQTAEAVVPPGLLLFLRFLIASGALLPFLARTRLTLRDWWFGLGVGMILGLAIYSQGIALKTVSVDEMAFIGALYVVFVPLAVAVTGRQWPKPILWVSVAASLIGVVMLIGHLSLGLRVGTFWSFAGAIGLTLQILGTSRMSHRVPPLAVAGLQSLGAALILLVPFFISQLKHPDLFGVLGAWSPTVWLEIGYLAIFAQAIAIWLQGWGQRWVSETEAALAFNTEPVWTALFALLVLGQFLTLVQLLGAILVTLSLSLLTLRTGERSSLRGDHRN